MKFDIAAFILTILARVVIAAIVSVANLNSIQILSEPLAGSLLGIVGIIASAIVGFSIFWMQKKADQRINQIIEKEHRRLVLRKLYWIGLVLNELEAVKEKHYKALKYVTEFSDKKHDPQFIYDMRQFFLLENYAFMYRHIPQIQEAGMRLVDLLEDTQLAIDLRDWIVPSGGPYYSMVEGYNLEHQYGSLTSELSLTNMTFSIQSHLQTVVDLITRMHGVPNVNTDTPSTFY
jgi:hypothetical protein